MDFTAADWIIVSYSQQGKQLVFAQRLSEIRRVDVDSKLSGGKLKRTWAWTLRDGSIYTLPDDAVIVHQPSEYAQLIAAAATSITI